MSLLAPPGAIVRMWFPETETVMQPGPKFRPCLVLEVDDSSKVPRVLVAYGTSQHTERYGRGELVVKTIQAPELERDTKICLNKTMWLPLTRVYFASHGKQPRVAFLPRTLYGELARAMREVGLL